MHNHYGCGSAVLEDVWLTKNLIHRQLSGISGFCFTSSYLVITYFGKTKQLHHQFKIAAENCLVNFQSTSLHETRKIDNSLEGMLHVLVKIPYSKDCYYCQRGYDKPRTKHTTTFKCSMCNILLCEQTKNKCWDLHLANGIPKKRYHKKV